MKKIILIVTLNFCFYYVSAQVGIGTTMPDVSSSLDINSGSTGLLIPRVSLVNVSNGTTPVNAPATSLLVYNTNALVAGGKGVGYYFWSGTQWTKLFDTATPIPQNWTRNGFGQLFPTTISDYVGIGTTNPYTNLHIVSASSNPVIFDGGSNLYITFAENGINRGYYGSYAGNPEDIEFGTYSGNLGAVHLTTNNSPKLTVINNGNIGIGTTTPNALLQFSNIVVNRKIVLYDTNNNDNQYYGFGINGAVLRYQTDSQLADHVFYAGVNATTSSELMRIKGTGNVGIGTSIPSSRLEVNSSGLTEFKLSSTLGFGATRFSMISDRGLGSEWRPAYIEDGDNGGFTGRMDFYTNGTGGGSLFGSVRAMSLVNGSVGIGTTAPAQRLDVLGGNARINNMFIGDVGHGSTWAGMANYSQANPTGYGFLQSSDGNYTFINKQNTGLGYIGFRIANTDQAVITNAGNMGIGTTVPAQKLDVIGKVKITDGTQGSNKVLTSDGAGTGSWQNVGNIIQTWQTTNSCTGGSCYVEDVGTAFVPISSITTTINVSAKTRLLISAVVNMKAWQLAAVIGGWGEIRLEVNGSAQTGTTVQLYNLNDTFSTGTFSNYMLDVNPGTYTISVTGRSTGYGINVDFNGKYMSIMGLPIN